MRMLAEHEGTTRGVERIKADLRGMVSEESKPRPTEPAGSPT
jgi:hypothetical protein